MCHMLEHVVDLRAALREINDSLPPNGTVLLAWPELETWTLAGVAGALNFEHGLYVTVPRLEALFEEFGWRKSAEQHFGENDTVFLAFTAAWHHAEIASPRFPLRRQLPATSPSSDSMRQQSRVRWTRTMARHS